MKKHNSEEKKAQNIAPQGNQKLALLRNYNLQTWPFKQFKDIYRFSPFKCAYFVIF